MVAAAARNSGLRQASGEETFASGRGRQPPLVNDNFASPSLPLPVLLVPLRGNKSYGFCFQSAADASRQGAGSRPARGDPHLGGARYLLFDVPSLLQPPGAPSLLPPVAASSQRRRSKPSGSMLPRPPRLPSRHPLSGSLAIPPPCNRGTRFSTLSLVGCVHSFYQRFRN